MDVKAMREIVKAATPGKWMLGDENNSSAEVMLGAKHNLVVCLDRYDKNTGEQVISREQMLANARHIITFNPESVTALLDALEAAQAEIARLNKLYIQAVEGRSAMREALQTERGVMAEVHKLVGGTVTPLNMYAKEIHALVNQAIKVENQALQDRLSEIEQEREKLLARIKELEAKQVRGVPVRAITMVLDRFKEDQFNAFMRVNEIKAIESFLKSILSQQSSTESAAIPKEKSDE